MIRNIINLKAIILYFGLILCLIAGMPTPAYGSSSYPVKEESYVLVINSYVDGERWSGNLLNMISKFATPEEYTLRIDHISVMLVDTPEKLKEKQEVFFEANKKKPDGIIYLGVNGWAFMRDKIREKWGDIPTLVCSETGEMAEDECYFNQRHSSDRVIPLQEAVKGYNATGLVIPYYVKGSIDLVKALDEVEGIERYRISSIEPNLLTDEIIEYVSRSRRFMPHFHIPLQSGSDEVLKLMRRRYDTALFASKIKKIKEVMPDSFIGVDVIVGTRGETEEYFGQAYEFIKSLDVTQLHVFSYSERPGTQALKIDHVVAPEEKHRRSQQLLELSDEKTRAFYARHIGQTMPVLLERPKPGLPMHGFTPNYIRVEVPHDAALDNQLVSVRLGDFNADGTALLGAME